jgi:hypothetical protein
MPESEEPGVRVLAHSNPFNATSRRFHNGVTEL